MTEREAIARRASSPRWMYLISLVFGLVLTGWMIWACIRLRFNAVWVFCVVVGFVIIAVSAVLFVRGIKTPKEIAVREGDTLIFLGRRMALRELVNVRYRRAHARGWSYEWGKLTVCLTEGRSYTAHFVADVEEAHDRLIYLMREAVDQGENNG